MNGRFAPFIGLRCCQSDYSYMMVQIRHLNLADCLLFPCIGSTLITEWDYVLYICKNVAISRF